MHKMTPSLASPIMTSCAACGRSAGTETVLERLRRCQGCGFIYYPDADSDSLSLIYDDTYFNGAEYPDYLGQQDALRRSMRRHLDQMKRHHPLGGSLLEVGCAYGLFLDEARPWFTAVTGIDVCEGPIAYARDVLGLDAITGDLLSHDFGNQLFDVVCMWDTIEHLPAPDAMLSRAAELLRPGAMLYLTTGDIGSWNARWRGKHWRQIHPPTHVSYFSGHTMRTLLDRTGYDVLAIERARYFHTVYNILASIRLRGGMGARVADKVLTTCGEGRARRFGLWLDLGDIMFVAAQRRVDVPRSAWRRDPNRRSVSL
jgi:SAM-dependent methyltransferase